MSLPPLFRLALSIGRRYVPVPFGPLFFMLRPAVWTTDRRGELRSIWLDGLRGTRGSPGKAR